MKFLLAILILSLTALAEPAGTGRALLHIYPNANPLLDWIVVKNADGTETILRFNEAKLGPRPAITAQHVAAADAAREAAAQAEQEGKERLDAIIAKLQGGQPLTAPERIAFDLSVAKALKALSENPRGNGQGQANKPQ